MKFLTEFMKCEEGEIKIGAIIIFLIGVLLLYMFWEEAVYFIRNAFSIENINF